MKPPKVNIAEMRFLVLCEDIAHQKLLRKYLEKSGANTRKATFWDLPAGKGAGEQYVRENLAHVVNTYRKKWQEHIAVIAVADGDTSQARKRALLATLEPARSDHERIAILIPVRNIESWVACFRDKKPVDEALDYKLDPHRRVTMNTMTNDEWNGVVQNIKECCHPTHQQPPNLPLPASFQDAVQEWQRLGVE